MKKVLGLAIAASAALSLSACDWFNRPAAENTTSSANTSLGEEPSDNQSAIANETLGNDAEAAEGNASSGNSTDGNTTEVGGNTL